jgi:hypothetical protein
MQFKIPSIIDLIISVSHDCIINQDHYTKKVQVSIILFNYLRKYWVFTKRVNHLTSKQFNELAKKYDQFPVSCDPTFKSIL